MVNTNSMRKWEELRLFEQLVSLRHLPLDSWLPEPSYESDNALITELLHLHDESDPLQWLKQNKSHLISRVLLWTSLTRIQSLIQRIQHADKAGTSTSAGKYRQWLGNLLQLPENVDPFQKLIGTHPTIVSSKLLQTVFQELHILRGGDERKLVNDNEIWILLDDLFQLPIATDPLQRIENKHNHLAAVETLRHIFSQVRPPRDLLVGQTMIGVVDNVLHPKIRLKARGLPIKFHEIACGKSSFALTLRTRVSERTLRRDSSSNSIWLAWQGVERVTDDLGHHYLVCHRSEEGGNRLWWFDHSLQLICYPAIVPAATEIILNNSQMSLVVLGTMSGEQMSKPKPLHQIELGNLTWRVKITR